MFNHIFERLSCRDTRQAGMRFEELNNYFYKVENFPGGEIMEGNYSKPQQKSWNKGVPCRGLTDDLRQHEENGPSLVTS